MIQNNPWIVEKEIYTEKIKNYIKNINNSKNRMLNNGMKGKWKTYIEE